jgi:late competence protein required for DNA uptake (superfamily II DNA/RNA helicase)
MKYLEEWRDSGVDAELINLNVTSLAGVSPSEYLLYSQDLPRRNDGRVSDGILKRYEHTNQGGWWCSGIDLLTGNYDLWGCFKPDFPRLSFDKAKPIKYEHPPQTPTGVFALRVPLTIWQRIAQRISINILTEEVDNKQDDLGFWSWVIEHPEIPICITEGAKKAGALLTAGYVTIALPGIHNGYRTPKDELGRRIGKSHLIPQLQKLANSGRKIYLVFDQETKPKTQQAVNLALQRMGYLFSQANCEVKVVTWNDTDGKGVDDLLINRGEDYFQQVYQKAVSWEVWKAQSLNSLTIQPHLEVNSRYLPDIAIPSSAQLIAIKSTKGTGKTEFLAKLVKQAIAAQKKVLVIGHRVKLVEELCQRFGLNYISEVRDNSTAQIAGYGLCIDSLHPQSQAKFRAEDWQNTIIIIDEIEQVLWHGLNGDTCKNNRVAILKSLKTLMQTVMTTGGKVLIADADLSDISLDYLTSLAAIELETFLISNDWKPSYNEAWRVYNYAEKTPQQLVKDLVKHIKEGGKPFICLSAQKLTSKWGTINLESYLRKQFPKKKIIRIDSESLQDSSHDAYQAIGNLNQLLLNYDIVVASPAIETGISIDIQKHFTSVWCLAQGIQTPTSICQFLGRIRENIPRYIWSAVYGFNQVGNGSTSIPKLLTSGHRLTEVNIRLLHQSDLESLEDLDTGFQAESLLCWAKMAVRVNAYMLNYRESILGILQAEGHRIKERNQGEELETTNQLTEAIEEIREHNYRTECEAIATAADINESEYRLLKKQLVKSVVERRILRKYDLQKRYGIPVNPHLVIKDDQGWYQELRLHYFLTIGRQFLCDRDALIARKLIESGHGSLFIPDFNGSQLGVIIGTLEVLGIPVLLANPERELTNSDLDLQKMAEIAIKNRAEIKTITKVNISNNSRPLTIIRNCLNLLGYELTSNRSQRISKKSLKVYQIVIPNDGREQVFQQWLFRDEKCAGSSEIWYDDYLFSLTQKPLLAEPENAYIQLSLEL